MTTQKYDEIAVTTTPSRNAEVMIVENGQLKRATLEKATSRSQMSVSAVTTDSGEWLRVARTSGTGMFFGSIALCGTYNSTAGLAGDGGAAMVFVGSCSSMNINYAGGMMTVATLAKNSAVKQLRVVAENNRFWFDFLFVKCNTKPAIVLSGAYNIELVTPSVAPAPEEGKYKIFEMT